jgi:hypothetical protein
VRSGIYSSSNFSVDLDTHIVKDEINNLPVDLYTYIHNYNVKDSPFKKTLVFADLTVENQLHEFAKGIEPRVEDFMAEAIGVKKLADASWMH